VGQTKVQDAPSAEMYDRPYSGAKMNFNDIPISILKYRPDKKDRSAKHGSEHHSKKLKYAWSQLFQTLIHARKRCSIRN
jgi:hypothetical protein